MKREPKNERGGRGRGRGRGRKEKNACRQTPRFWKPAFVSECSAWMARLVEQYWHVSIKGLFHTDRSWKVRDTHKFTVVVVYSGRQDLPSNARTFSLTSLLFFPTPSPLFYLRHHLTLVPKPHGNFCYAGYQLTLQGSRRRQFSQKIPVYSLDISHGIVLCSICGYVTSVFTFCQGLLRVSRWVSVITCFLVMPSCSRVWLSWFQLTSKYFNLLQPCQGNTAQIYSRSSANGHFFWRKVHTLACEQQTYFRSSLLRPEIRLLFRRLSIHWPLFKPLYNGHFLQSPRWPLWRGSTVLFLD